MPRKINLARDLENAIATEMRGGLQTGMNGVSEIQEKLRETKAAIAEMEKAIANDPKSQALSAMMKSLMKRRQKLEQARENRGE